MVACQVTHRFARVGDDAATRKRIAIEERRTGVCRPERRPLGNCKRNYVEYAIGNAGVVCLTQLQSSFIYSNRRPIALLVVAARYDSAMRRKLYAAGSLLGYGDDPGL